MLSGESELRGGVLFFFLFLVRGREVHQCKYKDTHTHHASTDTQKKSQLSSFRPGQLILKLQKASICSACSVEVEHRVAPAVKPKAPHTHREQITHSRRLVLSYVFQCVFKVKRDSWPVLFYAQTLKTRCCYVCSPEGVNLPATSGSACQNVSSYLYLCPSTLIIPASGTLWPLPTGPITASARPSWVTMMMMSPLRLSCSDGVIKMCILCVLARRTRRYKKHVKRECNQEGGG